MNVIALIAEKKIKAAIDNGEFDGLPGHGKPLAWEDFSEIPEHLRVGFKILKNAGVLPVEMELRKELAALREKLETCREAGEQKRLRQSINTASMKYHVLMERHTRRPQKP